MTPDVEVRPPTPTGVQGRRDDVAAPRRRVARYKCRACRHGHHGSCKGPSYRRFGCRCSICREASP